MRHGQRGYPTDKNNGTIPLFPSGQKQIEFMSSQLTMAGDVQSVERPLQEAQSSSTPWKAESAVADHEEIPGDSSSSESNGEPNVSDVSKEKITVDIPSRIPDTGIKNKLRFILIIISMSLSIFLVAVDRGIVAVAMYVHFSMALSQFSPTITDEFRSLTDVGWYGSAYLLAATAFQPTWGKAYQMFPLKRVFVFVMAIFLLGSILSATALNSAIFILGRAVAGMGSGGIFLANLTIIAIRIPLHRRPAYTSGLTSIFAVIALLTSLMTDC